MTNEQAAMNMAVDMSQEIIKLKDQKRELLEALKRLVANLDEGEFISITRIEEARAAIAKAEEA